MAFPFISRGYIHTFADIILIFSAVKLRQYILNRPVSVYDQKIPRRENIPINPCTEIDPHHIKQRLYHKHDTDLLGRNDAERQHDDDEINNHIDTDGGKHLGKDNFRGFQITDP